MTKTTTDFDAGERSARLLAAISQTAPANDESLRIIADFIACFGLDEIAELLVNDAVLTDRQAQTSVRLERYFAND